LPRETLVSAHRGRQYASLLAKAATPLAGGRKQILVVHVCACRPDRCWLFVRRGARV